MFAVSSTFISPQTVFPLSSYLLSHCSAVRSASHRKVSCSDRGKNNLKDAEKKFSKATTNLEELLRLPDNVTLNQIQAVMTPNRIKEFALNGKSFVRSPFNMQSRRYSHNLTPETRPSCYESHVSFNTFDENKRGISIQSEVSQAMFRKIFLSQYKFLSPLIMSNIGSTRGFRTHRSEERKVIREMQLSESQIKPEVMQHKLSALLKDGMPADTEKALKVAFAEGYLAADPTKKEEPKSRLKKFAEKFVGFILLFSILITVGLMIMMSNIGNSSFSIRIGNKSEVMPEEIDVSFNDVKGSEEAKLELEEIVDFLKHPQKYTVLGAELPRGVLLVGPPGTGKTLLARAVAGEAGVPFFHASGSEFDEILVGQGAKRVRQLFATAKMKAPCVVFIDEIDSVGAKRSSSVLHPYANQTINQLLSEMDGFHKHDGVIVLGATNRRQDLDRALLRPGRFDVEVQVPIPDLKGRVEILSYYLEKVKLGKDIDQTVLGRGTTGFTGADLKNIVNQAALRAAADELESISMKHLEEARDKVLMGPERKAKILDKETNLITAFHESGHTLVAHYTQGCHPLHKVTIIPRGSSLGHTASIPAKEQYHMTRQQMVATMDSLMGGRVAEEVTFGMDKVTSGASSDLKQATNIATSMVKDFGMSDKVGFRTFDEGSDQLIGPGTSLGDHTKEAIDFEIKKLLQESYERAKAIIKTHNGELKALADALIRYETLDAEDVKAILDGKTIEKDGL